MSRVTQGVPRKILWAVLALALVCAPIASGVISGLIIKQNIQAADAKQRQRLVDAAAAAQHRLFMAQVNGCYRQNKRTAAVNVNAKASYLYNKTFLLDLRVQPTPPSRRALLADFTKKLAADADSTTWVPVNTNCARAPTRLELPVRFVVRFPGPADLKTT